MNRCCVLVLLLASCTPNGRGSVEGAPRPLVPVRQTPQLLPDAPRQVVEELTTTSSEPSPPRRPGSYANLDPDDDFVVGPPDVVEDCEGALRTAGITWRPFSLPVHKQRQKSAHGSADIVCGAPQVVLYARGPGNITYNPPPVVTCTMALALASFERLLQEEALRTFQSPVTKIDQLGTYSCREVARYPGTISEHSYANAIDVGRFYLKNGRALDIYRDFDRTDGDPPKPAGLFLRRISRRANDEEVFSHVLTPFFDEIHRNHFHLDLARYRTDGTRPR